MFLKSYSNLELKKQDHSKIIKITQWDKVYTILLRAVLNKHIHLEN